MISPPFLFLSHLYVVIRSGGFPVFNAPLVMEHLLQIY